MLLQIIFHPKKSLSLLFILLASHLIAQDKIDSAITTLSDKYPQEKIYIAYNKSQYIAGETIWLKGFIFSGYHASGISTNLYTELYDVNKTLLGKKTLPIFNGVAEGTLHLADSLPEGIYYVRAYTGWMLNFSEDFQYLQPLLVYNPLSKRKLQINNTGWDAAAFIEGGTLLNNRQSGVAIRLSSVGTLPLHWHGYLLDLSEPLNKILSFKSLDKNVAFFNFVPKAAKQYSVMIEDDSMHSKRINLPQILTAGVDMSVKQQDSTLEYRIDFSNLPENETYKIVGTIDNEIVYKATIKNIDSTFIHSFSTAQFPPGVMRFTLFNKDYSVVAERLCFIYPQIKFRPSTDSISFNAKARAENNFSLGLDSGATYSVAVFDEKTPDFFAENNVSSTCWLTGDFKNKIHDAGGYFNNSNSKIKDALDALLITEKWKRFDWKDIIEGRLPAIKYQKDNYLSYVATVKYRSNILPDGILNFVLFLPDSTKQFMQAKTDAYGNFSLDGLAFEDSARVSFKSTIKRLYKEDLQVIFTRQNPFVKYIQPLPETNYVIVADTDTTKVYSKEVLKDIANFKNERNSVPVVSTLKAVIVKSHGKSAKQLLDEKLSSGRFYSEREVIYDFVNEKQAGTEGSNLSFWLMGRVPGDPRQTNYFLDEFHIDKDMASTISMSDIAMIKIQGSGASHLVLIYMRRGAQMMVGNPLNNTVIHGYEHQDNFRLPNFSETLFKNWQTDNRDLLYWNNNIFADSTNQKVKINFNNNDYAQKFRLVIMGISVDGGPFFYDGILDKKR